MFNSFPELTSKYRMDVSQVLSLLNSNVFDITLTLYRYISVSMCRIAQPVLWHFGTWYPGTVQIFNMHPEMLWKQSQKTIFSFFWIFLPVLTSNTITNRRCTKLRAKYRVICKTLDKDKVKLALNNIVRELEATRITMEECYHMVLSLD
jgi:hypothetical protein